MNKLKINQIFYSIQGEGGNVGMPAIFIRLSGCNLSCAFCDTNHSCRMQLTPDELLKRVQRLSMLSNCKNIIWTGGEPCLQLTDEIVEVFRKKGYYQCIETNGTLPCTEVDYIAVSPKQDKLHEWYKGKVIDEIRIVVPLHSQITYEVAEIKKHYFSPIFDKDESVNKDNLKTALHLLEHCNEYKLSVQIHKLLSLK